MMGAWICAFRRQHEGPTDMEPLEAYLKEIRGKTFWLGICLWLTAAPLTLLAILYWH